MSEEIKCPICRKGLNSPCEVCNYHWDYYDGKAKKRLDTMETQIDQISLENRDLDIRLNKLEKEVK